MSTKRQEETWAGTDLAERAGKIHPALRSMIYDLLEESPRLQNVGDILSEGLKLADKIMADLDNGEYHNSRVSGRR